MMTRKKRKMEKDGRTIQKGWYEGKVKGVPKGFISFRNPQKKKLSNLV